MAGGRTEILLAQYEEMCALTSREVEALGSRDWTEVERLEGMRRELFSRISSAGVFVPPPEPSKEDASMIERLKGLVARLAELGRALGGAAKDGMEALGRDLRTLDVKRKAMKVYFPRGGSRGAVFIDKNF